MKTLVCEFALLLSALLPAFASGYRGVEVGQRSDLLPAEFSEVERGLYQAQFGRELMQVFVRGALVSAIKVVPTAPMTLAEAVAAHVPNVTPGDLTIVYDLNGRIVGIGVPNQEIVFLDRSFAPDSTVQAVGYYNYMTAKMLWMTALPPQEAQQLIAAAKKANPEAPDQRPEIAEGDRQAEYLLEQRIKAATAEGQKAVEGLQQYRTQCVPDARCKRNQVLRTVLRSTLAFQNRLRTAEQMFKANADLLGYTRPLELDYLQDVSDRLLREVRAAVDEEIAVARKLAPQR